MACSLVGGCDRGLNPESGDRGVNRRCRHRRRARHPVGANEVQISKNRSHLLRATDPTHNGSGSVASQNTSKAPSFLPSKCACSKGGNFRATSFLPRLHPHRKKMTEVEQETQGVKVGEGTAGVVPLFYEFRAFLRRRKKRLQDRCGVIVEAQIS